MKNDLLEEHVRYGEARFRDKNIVRPFVNRIYQDLAELEEAMKPKTCDWKQCTSEYDTSWEGTCGVKWLLIDGTPTENHMKFCPQCGGKLIEISSKG